jgi:hypothetical protein
LDISAVSVSSGEYKSDDNPPVKRTSPSRGIGFGPLWFLRSPWAAPVFLLPFLLMLAVHWLLGLSDSLLVAENPGERPAHGYNLLLGINMNVCPLAAVLHVATKSQRETAWIITRLLIPTVLFLIGLLTL